MKQFLSFVLACLYSGGLPAADALVPGTGGQADRIAGTSLPGLTLPLNGRQTYVEVESPDNPLVIMSTTRGDLVIELFPREAPQTVANFLGLAEGSKPFIDSFTGRELTRPFYDGLIFHRVVDGFMVQGGSPTSAGNGTPGFTITDEINALSLGLDRMPLLDEDGYPNPVIGVKDQRDFQELILRPLYTAMGITNQQTLDARVMEVERRLRGMNVKQYLELLGYRFTERVQSRAPVRGVLAMAGSGPGSAGSQFFITLRDTPWLTGRHTVFGKVRAGMEIVEAIAKARVDENGRPQQDITILAVRRVVSPP